MSGMPTTSYHDALVDAQARKLLRLSPAMRQRLIDRFYEGDDDRKGRVVDRIKEIEEGDDPKAYRNPSDFMNELETLDTTDDPGNPQPTAAPAAGAKKVTKAEARNAELRKALMGEDTRPLDELLEDVAKSGTSAGAKRGWATRRGNGGSTMRASAITRERAKQTTGKPAVRSSAKPETKAKAIARLGAAEGEVARSSRARRAAGRGGVKARTAEAIERDAKGDKTELKTARTRAKTLHAGDAAAARQSNQAGYRALRAAGAKRRKRGAKITAGKAATQGAKVPTAPGTNAVQPVRRASALDSAKAVRKPRKAKASTKKAPREPMSAMQRLTRQIERNQARAQATTRSA